MKARWLSLIFLCAMAAAQCGTTTPGLGLNLPAYNASGWNTCLNTNFSTLDNYLNGVSILPAFKAAGLTLSGTGLTANTGTFSGNLSVSGTLTASTFSPATLSISGNGTIGGTFGVTGATTLSSTLGVSGATALAAVSATTGIFSGQVTSSLSTGTAPFAISSTTTVPNLTVSNHPIVQECGSTTSCAGTLLAPSMIVTGQVTLTGGAATITGISPPFANTGFRCTTETRTNTTDITVCHVNSVSSITCSGTGTDTAEYICVGSK